MIASRRRYHVPLPGNRTLALGERCLVMGILNITPDSFADASRIGDVPAALEAALRMEADGADLLDVGGESTRPGAEPVSEAEELTRVVPVVAALAGRVRVPISIDTYKGEVARAAIAAGASTKRSTAMSWPRWLVNCARASSAQPMPVCRSSA